jgi:hypothetical protein
MFWKKEILYFVNPEGKILNRIKKPRIIPRKGEIIIFMPENKKYNVLELVYTYDKNLSVCWVYLSDLN